MSDKENSLVSLIIGNMMPYSLANLRWGQCIWPLLLSMTCQGERVSSCMVKRGRSGVKHLVFSEGSRNDRLREIQDGKNIYLSDKYFPILGLCNGSF